MLWFCASTFLILAAVISVAVCKSGGGIDDAMEKATGVEYTG